MGSKNSKNGQPASSTTEQFRTMHPTGKCRKWLIILTVIIILIVICMVSWKMCKPRYTINLELDRMGIPGNIQEFAFLPEIAM